MGQFKKVDGQFNKKVDGTTYSLGSRHFPNKP